MPPSLLDILNRTTAFFEKAGLERPKLDAQWLLAAVLDCKRLELFLQFERPMESDVLDRLRPMVARRARREPLQYILGEVEFAGLTLKTDARALIPRPETDDLVNRLVTMAGSNPPRRILDLGTGSGAIALGLARAFPESQAVAVDRSAEALSLARENAQHNGLSDRVEWREGSWFEPVEGERFALIVSNPPYLTEAEWTDAQPEVKDHEPFAALVAPEDGLACLRQIIADAPGYLEPGAGLALETGLAQQAALAGWANAAGFDRWESAPDDSGRDRYFFAWAK